MIRHVKHALHGLTSLLARRPPLLVLIPAAVVAFLLIVAFGAPPHALGLDWAWTEVLAWGFLRGAQWGRDLVFTYGPLGFLQPYAAYVLGIFPWYVAGEIVLPAGFVLCLVLLLRRGSLALFALFAALYVGWCVRLGGDVSWALTLLFGSAWLLGGRERMHPARFYPAIVILASLFAPIALAKFSLFPLWLLCLAAITCALLLQRERVRAAACLLMFPLALVALWVGCGQHLQNLPVFLWRSFEVAAGYGHAMGIPAPRTYEFIGVAFSGGFLLTCARAAWLARADGVALTVIALNAATAVLFWLAFFTRGDHWPWFFPAISLLVFALLCDQRIGALRPVRPLLVALALTGLLMAGVVESPRNFGREVASRVRNGYYNLTHLDALLRRRNTEWRALVKESALLKVRAKIGNASIDVLPWEQGIVIVNELNYTPRPVFQSYSAYTPTLARLNEAHFLDADAPRYAAVRLETIDNHAPLSEDGLAMIALLEHYRPVLIEKGFLLLQRDPSPTPYQSLRPAGAMASTRFGSEVAVSAAAPSAAFIDIELSTFGKLYTLLFREPPLQLVLTLADGHEQRYRLVRGSAAAGFLVSPSLQGIGDWSRLYFSKPVQEVRSLRIETESAADRLIFRDDVRVRLQAVDVLRANAAEVPAALGASLLYPGFNLEPAAPADLKIVAEGERDAVFVHAPGTITFRPAPGRYRVTATFGVQTLALNDPGCIKAGADGIGVSIVRRHAGGESILWHAESDPFHGDPRGAQNLRVDSVEVSSGDSIDYRVDPGHDGANVSCDWSYVRDFKFERRLETAADVAATYPGFNLAPANEDLRVLVDDGKDSVFLHAPASMSFHPAPGRYAISATYGVQSVALRDQGCIDAGANGVGVSLVVRHGGRERVAWHEEIDPFHVSGDRGPHALRAAGIVLAPGDSVDYRVDAGQGGDNAACDWSYVRDFVFSADAAPAQAPRAETH
jgi:hypothetical protein